MANAAKLTAAPTRVVKTAQRSGARSKSLLAAMKISPLARMETTTPVAVVSSLSTEVIPHQVRAPSATPTTTAMIRLVRERRPVRSIHSPAPPAMPRAIRRLTATFMTPATRRPCPCRTPAR